MAYFKNLPNIEYVNRFKGSKSNDEVTIAKNLFRRSKLREDLESVFTTFDFYKVEENERPEQIAKACLLYTSPSPRDATLSRMPSSA